VKVGVERTVDGVKSARCAKRPGSVRSSINNCGRVASAILLTSIRFLNMLMERRSTVRAVGSITSFGLSPIEPDDITTLPASEETLRSAQECKPTKMKTPVQYPFELMSGASRSARSKALQMSRSLSNDGRRHEVLTGDDKCKYEAAWMKTTLKYLI
jgi:hypothetical protein